MASFWAHGYHSTSVADLMAATGLAKGSLYKGFGDKKRLFMLALESYLTSGAEALDSIGASSTSGRQALESVLYGVAEAATPSGARCGCFAVNSAVELGPHDPEVRTRLQQYTRDKLERLAGFVERGVADGSLRSDLDPDATARHLTVLADGLQAQGKLGMTKKHAEEVVASALASLCLSSA